jgi:hypothetical protein
LSLHELNNKTAADKINAFFKIFIIVFLGESVNAVNGY